MENENYQESDCGNLKNQLIDAIQKTNCEEFLQMFVLNYEQKYQTKFVYYHDAVVFMNRPVTSFEFDKARNNFIKKFQIIDNIIKVKLDEFKKLNSQFENIHLVFTNTNDKIDVYFILTKGNSILETDFTSKEFQVFKILGENLVLENHFDYNSYLDNNKQFYDFFLKKIKVNNPEVSITEYLTYPISNLSSFINGNKISDTIYIFPVFINKNVNSIFKENNDYYLRHLNRISMVFSYDDLENRISKLIPPNTIVGDDIAQMHP